MDPDADLRKSILKSDDKASKINKRLSFAEGMKDVTTSDGDREGRTTPVVGTRRSYSDIVPTNLQVFILSHSFNTVMAIVWSNASLIVDYATLIILSRLLSSLLRYQRFFFFFSAFYHLFFSVSYYSFTGRIIKSHLEYYIC